MRNTYKPEPDGCGCLLFTVIVGFMVFVVIGPPLGLLIIIFGNKKALPSFFYLLWFTSIVIWIFAGYARFYAPTVEANLSIEASTPHIVETRTPGGEYEYRIPVRIESSDPLPHYICLSVTVEIPTLDGYITISGSNDPFHQAKCKMLESNDTWEISLAFYRSSKRLQRSLITYSCIWVSRIDLLSDQEGEIYWSSDESAYPDGCYNWYS